MPRSEIAGSSSRESSSTKRSGTRPPGCASATTRSSRSRCRSSRPAAGRAARTASCRARGRRRRTADRGKAPTQQHQQRRRRRAAPRNLPSTMSQIVSGLVSSSSWVPLVFSAANRPIVTPGTRNSSTTDIVSKKLAIRWSFRFSSFSWSKAWNCWSRTDQVVEGRDAQDEEEPGEHARTARARRRRPARRRASAARAPRRVATCLMHRHHAIRRRRAPVLRANSDSRLRPALRELLERRVDASCARR